MPSSGRGTPARHVTAYRVVKRAFAPTAFDGEGARRDGGRFNLAGTPAVYVADSLALALLEVAVHVPSYRALRGRVAFEVAVPEELVEVLDEAALPADWRTAPPPPAVQLLGDRWLREGRSVALRVPSTVLARSFNYVLNPAHPDFGALRIGEPFGVPVDPRLVK